MSAGPRRRAVRVSLTLWYVGAMLIVLGVYASGVFLFVSRNLSNSLNEELEGDFEWAAELIVHFRILPFPKMRSLASLADGRPKVKGN